MEDSFLGIDLVEKGLSFFLFIASCFLNISLTTIRFGNLTEAAVAYILAVGENQSLREVPCIYLCCPTYEFRQ